MKYLKNVATLKLDSSKCSGCSICTQVCPHAVIEMRDGRAAVKDLDACMECGACVKNCPAGALSVNYGVGCAMAIITGALTGKEPACGCSSDGKSGCC